MVIHMMEHPPEGWGANGAEYFLRKRTITKKTLKFLSLSQKLLVQFSFLMSQNDRIASPQILRYFNNC